MSKRLSLAIGLVMLIVASMACTIGGATAVPEATQPPATPPSSTAAPINTKPAVATFPPVAPSTIPPTVPGEALPTDTPTPSPTPTPTTTPKPPAASNTPALTGTSGPLSVKYEVVSIKRKNGDQAVMTLRVIASGGGGGYRYYHEDVLQAGPIFEVAGTCNKPFNHTIKVTSADGQTVRVQYFEQGKCS